MNASAICEFANTIFGEYIFSIGIDISIPVVFCKRCQTGIAHNNASQLLSFLCLIHTSFEKKIFFSWEASDKQAECAKDNRCYANTKSNSFWNLFQVSPIRLNPLINGGNLRRKTQEAPQTIDTISIWVLANFGSDFVSHYRYHVSPVIDELTPGNRVLEILTVVQLVNKFSTFMKFEGPLLCSQEPAIKTHPDPSKVSIHCFIPLRPVLIL
jgi:hypothetical protein